MTLKKICILLSFSFISGSLLAAPGDPYTVTRGSGLQSIRIGDGADAPSPETSDIAIGYKSKADGATKGPYGGTNAMAIGSASEATAPGALAIGTEAKATGAQSVSVGLFSKADNNSVAVGAASNASEKSVSIGLLSNVTGTSSVAIGTQTSVSASNSVALGNGSKATEDNTVSVGDDNNKRRITNVANAVNDNDAVTLQQLNSTYSSSNNNYNLLNNRVDHLSNRVDHLSNKIDHNRKISSQGVASAMATQIDMPYPDNNSFAGGVGFGTYDGESAMAVGAGYLSTSGKHKFSAAISSGLGNDAKQGGRISWGFSFK